MDGADSESNYSRGGGGGGGTRNNAGGGGGQSETFKKVRELVIKKIE